MIEKKSLGRKPFLPRNGLLIIGARQSGSMKTALLALCLALLPLPAQDNPKLKQLTLGPVRTPYVPKIRVAAKDIQQDSGIVYLKGSVEIDLGLYVLLADEAEYYQESGELRPHGDVRVKAKPADIRGVSQFGIK
jgi:lipopolysaccharide assembly outer membrane protein LptD (OstA)